MFTKGLSISNVLFRFGLFIFYKSHFIAIQGSSIFNDVYGSVNRTGLVIAGAALIGVSGRVPQCYPDNFNIDR